jgi:hypothetical protein
VEAIMKDNNKLITENWLISIGFVHVESDLGIEYQDHLEKDGLNLWEYSIGIWLFNDADWMKLYTRGDVRSLCKLAKVATDEKIEESPPIECRSEEGITIGLIDAIISISRVLSVRDLTARSVAEALLDLSDNTDLLNILKVRKIT